MRVIAYMQICLIVTTVFFIGCNSTEQTRANNRNGYVKKYDTMFNSKTPDTKLVYRTFYQKTPTIHNSLIQIKECLNDNNIYLTTNEKETSETISFKINDFNTFLNQTDYVINSNLNNITVALDSLEQTYIRKSLSFKKGIFVIHIYDTNRNILFDLSENDVAIIKKAYKQYLEE